MLQNLVLNLMHCYTGDVHQRYRTVRQIYQNWNWRQSYPVMTIEWLLFADTVLEMNDVVFFITVSNKDDILKVIIVFDFKSEESTAAYHSSL